MAKSEKQRIWSQRVAAWARSGLSRRAWCAAHGVNTHTFDYWRRRVEGPRAQSRKRGSQALVPIVIGEDAATVPAAMELVLGGGMALRLPTSIDATWLARLVRELSAC